MTKGGFSDNVLDTIADSLTQTGYAIVTDVIEHQLLCQLEQRVQTMPASAWRAAKIRRGLHQQTKSAIRSDKTVWLDAANKIDNHFLCYMESLRVGLNQRLYLGLVDYEAHFAVYAKGAYYSKHKDSFHGEKNRVISTVLYLNKYWQPEEGGQLVLYRHNTHEAVACILPEGGRLVLFLSDDFPHEVKPASRKVSASKSCFYATFG